MDGSECNVDSISTASDRAVHFLLSGNWICRRVLGQGIVVENNVSGEKIHLHNESNGWFVIKPKQDKAIGFNYYGQQESILPIVIEEK